MSILKAVLVLCFLLTGCGGSEADQPTRRPVVETVRAEVAKVLGTSAERIDVTKPLNVFGADELDVVEIVLAVEGALNVTIPDSALGEQPSKTLTVERLAEIAAAQSKTK